MSGGVTVLMPVGPGVARGALERALGSIAEQTVAPAATLLVANGVSDAEMAVVERAAAQSGCPGVRLDRLVRGSLAGALNHGLRASPTRWVARMDADDVSMPERLEAQLAVAAPNSGLAAVGCAWEVVGTEGQVRAIMRPPTDPARLAWMLLLGNVLAHGSMLLDRDAVLSAGGYDERLERAQDYELWLRMVRGGARIGASGAVLYRYLERGERGVAATSAAQAASAAAAMVGAWEALPSVDSTQRGALEAAIAGAMRAEHGGDAAAALAGLLDAGAVREGLLAWLWARERHPPLPRRAIEVCRRARLREVGARIRAEGGDRVWLWGAGQHTGWVVEHAADLGVGIAGIVDDHAAGQAWGYRVQRPEAIAPGEHALLSSDWHEEAMWEGSARHRARGVVVWRLYTDD